MRGCWTSIQAFFFASLWQEKLSACHADAVSSTVSEDVPAACGGVYDLNIKYCVNGYCTMRIRYNGKKSIYLIPGE